MLNVVRAEINKKSIQEIENREFKILENRAFKIVQVPPVIIFDDFVLMSSNFQTTRRKEEFGSMKEEGQVPGMECARN